MHDARKAFVDRFLAWKLPTTMRPDDGISFDPISNRGNAYERKREPTGTNLFDATEAGQLFDEVVARVLREAAPAPTPSEQRASAKPQEAEMREVLRSLRRLFLAGDDAGTWKELRGYAATERASARREAMEEARLAMRPVAFLVESTDYRAAFFHEDEAQERADKVSGGVYHGLYRRDPPQRNNAGGEPNPYVGVTDQNSAEIEARLSSPPDPLNRPVTYRALIDIYRSFNPYLPNKIAEALERSASLHTGER